MATVQILLKDVKGDKVQVTLISDAKGRKKFTLKKEEGEGGASVSPNTTAEIIGLYLMKCYNTLSISAEGAVIEAESAKEAPEVPEDEKVPENAPEEAPEA